MHHIQAETSTPYSGEYKVTITGLKLKATDATKLTVNFFSLQAVKGRKRQLNREPIEKKKQPTL